MEADGGNVWAVIHHVYRSGSDVAVASNRTDDPQAWARAHHDALINMRDCQRQAERWTKIADELADEQYKATLRRLESGV